MTFDTKTLQDPYRVQVSKNGAWVATFTGRLPEARDSIARAQAAAAAGDTMYKFITSVILAAIDVREGEPERTLARLEVDLEHALKVGAQGAVPFLVTAIAYAELAAGRPKEACEKLEGVVPLVEGRVLHATAWSLWLLAEARRLLDDSAAEETAVQAQASGEQLGQLPQFVRLGFAPLIAEEKVPRDSWEDYYDRVVRHLGLGTLYLKLDMVEQARAALTTAMALYRAMEMTFWLPQAEAALAQAVEP